MRDRGIQQMRYYLGVEVTPLEVYDRYRDEGTPAEKLTKFPVIGFLFNPFVTRREDLTDVERRAQMFESSTAASTTFALSSSSRRLAGLLAGSVRSNCSF